jgi:acyl-CoA synthetase (AMP-forming)/AMP-acid ligase II
VGFRPTDRRAIGGSVILGRSGAAAPAPEGETIMESSTVTPMAAEAVDAPTLNEAFRRTAAAHPDIVAARTADDSVVLTWAQLRDRVDALAGGLHRLGVRRGDTVALMLGNRPEFHLADLAVATLGATPFSIYLTLPPEEVAYVCGDAGARVAIVEAGLLPVMLEARATLPGLEHVLVVDGPAGDDVLALADI